MNCPKCNAIIDDSSVICPVCGDHFAIEQQRNRFWQAKEKTYSILSDVFRSKLFLVFSIFLSVLCGAYLMSTFKLTIAESSMKYNLDIFSALTFAFALVSMIAAWQLYSAKSGRPDTNKIKKLRALPKTLRIIYKILYIILIVVAVICIIALSMVNSIFDLAAEEGIDIMGETAKALYENGVLSYSEAMELAAFDIAPYIGIIIAVFVVAMAAVIAYLILMAIAFKKMEAYIDSLLETCSSTTYTAPQKFSHKYVFVMGIIAAIPLISVGSDLSALASAALGGYMIVFSLLMKEIHAKQTANNEDIAAQEELLAKVADLTNKQMKENQKDAEEAATEEASAEEAPAEEATNE